MKTQFTLAVRYLAGRKLRTALTTLAIVFGVMVLFGTNTLVPTLMRAFQMNVLAAANEVDATVTLKTSDAFEAGIAAQIGEIEGVSAVSGLLSRLVGLPVDYFDNDPAAPDKITILTLVGVRVSQATALHSYFIQEGRMLAEDELGAAVVSESLAGSLGIRVGDILTLPAATGETQLILVGLLPERRMPGNEAVFVSLVQAQQMLDMGDKINAVEVVFDSLDENVREEISASILASVGDAYQVGALSTNSQLFTSLQIGATVFNVLGLLALLMGGFIIFNTFRTLVAERRKDLGMLRTLGASRGTIVGSILLEGLLQGVVGTALGIGLGYLLASGLISVITPIMRTFINLQVTAPVISPPLVISSVVIGLGVTLLAGLLPAISASKVSPLEALRPVIGASSLRRMAGAGFWSGALMVALALGALLTRSMALIGLGSVLLVIGLFLTAPALVTPIANGLARLLAVLFARGGTAQLAESNLTRQPSRAAITASTTMISLAIVLMAASMISSLQLGFEAILRKSLSADYIVLPPSIAVWGNNVGANEGLADDLRAIEGVNLVSSMRFAPTLVQGQTAQAMGIDPLTFPQVSGLDFSSGEEANVYRQLSEGRAVIVNNLLASTLGIAVGEAVELSTPTGRQMYTVVAVATDYLSAKVPTVTLSQANLSADFDQHEDMVLLLDLVEPRREGVEAALAETLGAYPQFTLVNGQAYVEQNLQLFQAAFAGLTAMVVFLAIPSLIAMVNTLVIGVIERTREIGTLRAIGATRKQVRTVLVAEALILAGIGTAFGLLTGLYLGYMAVQAIFEVLPLDYTFPIAGTVLAVAAGILFGVIAALIPASQAARLQIVESLRWE